MTLPAKSTVSSRPNSLVGFIKSLMAFFLVTLVTLVAIFLSWIIIPVMIACAMGVIGAMVARELHDKAKAEKAENENKRQSRAQEQLRRRNSS